MSRPKVLLAEDEAIIRLDLRETLEEEGYEVVAETGRGDEVLELVDQFGPEVVILDVKMPGEDGISVARKLTEGRRAAVLILTAFSQRELIEQARDAGALAYLVKPFQRADLVPAIELALARYRDMRSLEAEVGGLEDALETRKLVDRAKGILMDSHRMREAEAFRWIQKTAMERRLTMRKLAEMIVDGSIEAPAD